MDKFRGKIEKSAKRVVADEQKLIDGLKRQKAVVVTKAKKKVNKPTTLYSLEKRVATEQKIKNVLKEAIDSNKSQAEVSKIFKKYTHKNSTDYSVSKISKSLASIGAKLRYQFFVDYLEQPQPINDFFDEWSELPENSDKINQYLEKHIEEHTDHNFKQERREYYLEKLFGDVDVNIDEYIEKEAVENHQTIKQATIEVFKPISFYMTRLKINQKTPIDAIIQKEEELIKNNDKRYQELIRTKESELYYLSITKAEDNFDKIQLICIILTREKDKKTKTQHSKKTHKIGKEEYVLAILRSHDTVSFDKQLEKMSMLPKEEITKMYSELSERRLSKGLLLYNAMNRGVRLSIARNMSHQELEKISHNPCDMYKKFKWIEGRVLKLVIRPVVINKITKFVDEKEVVENRMTLLYKSNYIFQDPINLQTYRKIKDKFGNAKYIFSFSNTVPLVWFEPKYTFLNLLCSSAKKEWVDGCLHIDGKAFQIAYIMKTVKQHPIVVRYNGKMNGLIIQDEALFQREKSYIEMGKKIEVIDVLEKHPDDKSERLARHEIMTFIQNCYKTTPSGDDEINISEYTEQIMGMIKADTNRMLFSNIGYLTAISYIPNANIFRQRVKSRYYLPNYLINIPLAEAVPELYEKDFDSNRNFKYTVANYMISYIDRYISTIALRLARSDLRSTLNLKITETVGIRMACKNQDMLSYISNPDNIAYYVDEEDENKAVYCFDVKNLILYTNENGDLRQNKTIRINPYTGKPFSKEFIRKYIVQYYDRETGKYIEYPYYELYKKFKKGQFLKPNSDEKFEKSFIRYVLNPDERENYVNTKSRINISKNNKVYCENFEDVRDIEPYNLISYFEGNKQYCFPIHELVERKSDLDSEISNLRVDLTYQANEKGNFESEKEKIDSEVEKFREEKYKEFINKYTGNAFSEQFINDVAKFQAPTGKNKGDESKKETQKSDEKKQEVWNYINEDLNSYFAKLEFQSDDEEEDDETESETDTEEDEEEEGDDAEEDNVKKENEIIEEPKLEKESTSNPEYKDEKLHTCSFCKKTIPKDEGVKTLHDTKGILIFCDTKCFRQYPEKLNK